MHTIAIVTGASSGLGAEFVRQLDAGQAGPLSEIWLVARSQDKLDAVAATCQTPTRTFALDLTDAASFDTLDAALAQAAAAANVNVALLVNCAGFGKFGPFTQLAEKDNANMLRLNCLATLEMCYRALPYMHPGARIINIASVAALLPQPGLDVYAATKRFVLDFSRGLDAELSGTGIHVTAVCPKFMHTNFLSNPGSGQAVNHMTWIGFEEPATCVRRALAASRLGKRCIITSYDMRLANGVLKVLPTRLAMDLEMAVGNLFGSIHA
jgi:hypothetical protein